MKVKKNDIFFMSLTGISGGLRISNLEISACVNFLSIIFESLKDKDYKDIFHLDFSFELKRFFDISINIFNIINGGFYIRNYTKPDDFFYDSKLICWYTLKNINFGCEYDKNLYTGMTIGDYLSNSKNNFYNNFYIKFGILGLKFSIIR